MSLIRILGVGSPLGDDDLGWWAVDLLECSDLSERLRPHRLELTRLDRPGPLLLDALKGADLVLLLDAMVSGAAPGTTRRLDPGELETLLAPVSSHGLDLPASLALARSLGIVEPRMIVIGIEVGMDRESQARTLTSELLRMIEQEVSAATLPESPT
jgi:hydrogenase maturation protease